MVFNKKRYDREYYIKHKKEMDKKAREYYKTHKSIFKEYSFNYRNKNNKKLKLTKKRYVLNNKEQIILSRCKIRAKKLGLICNIELKDIKIVKFCPILQIPIFINNGYSKDNSIAIDRIDNRKGYIKGNIQIISHKANTMKSNATPKELLKFADWIYRTYKKRKKCINR